MLFIVIILLLLVSLTFWYGPAGTPSPGGINRLEQITLDGVRQWISIRGAHAQAPVLLFLHGGPGSANLAKLRLQTPEPEKSWSGSSIRRMTFFMMNRKVWCGKFWLF